ASSTSRTPIMVETRQQEKSMLEQVEEMRLQQERHSDELRQRTESLDARFTKLETALFTFFSQGTAAGKQPLNEGSGSQSLDPLASPSNHPPDPPDLNGFPPRREPQHPLIPNETGSVSANNFSTSMALHRSSRSD
ncbi:hypothetical protein N665_0012s0261, partial [Sinapis alba]